MKDTKEKFKIDSPYGHSARLETKYYLKRIANSQGGQKLSESLSQFKNQYKDQ
ncbi:hypothetical protein SAMN03080617_02327 [Algoriphagus alkaliphilus]|uniref:Uncharacterized protein n=1 Tax=Algoriphagus alkaliphilus TaxID=279824 RepID=A0A1G5Y9F2_9BACT|nr:hypothetical protein SAMN03080617_02327 [Algoriphagus alkaliphilus]